ncbi:CPBP family intramembrane metalloprotease [Mariniblastus sp.]|nr:CPBP family intramembrane metalloprotease [Mariniblastus sp.]
MSSGATNPIGSKRQSSGDGSRSNANGEAKGATNHQAIADLLHSKLRARRKAPPQPTVAEPVPYYHQQTHRPIVCLAFVLPIVMIYEVCSILLANDAVRSGVDQWIGGMLSSLGVGQVVILPVVITAILVVWHHRRHDRWTFNPLVLAGMFIESSLLGLILYWSANAVYFLATVSLPDAVTAGAVTTESDWLVASISVLGSGIYEETFFRILLMLPMIAWATWLSGSREIGVTCGMILCSLIFALVHYSLFNPAGQNFEVSSFLFRFGASIVFCNLFLFRGFGIAVGSHVIYDLLTQL